MLYFAYGSNMLNARLRERVPSAAWVAVARLPGYCLAFRKLGRDGSTKCDLEPHEPETVWGVVHAIDPNEQDALDRAEGTGYQRIEVTVSTGDGFVDAFSYRALPEWQGEGRPFDWYRDLVVAGAREHELPAMYIEAIAAIDADTDTDPEREARHRALM